MILRIDRKRWLRGEGGMRSALLRKDGKMCCLGFLGIACGLGPGDLLDAGTPAEIRREDFDKWPDFVKTETSMWSIPVNSKVVTMMMRTNDDSDLCEAYREENLTKKFAAVGIKVIFEG